MPEPEVQESQGFKTLRSNLTADLEIFHMNITNEYVLKANDMNVEAKRTQFHFAICKWMRGLAAAFIAQTGVSSYNEDVAVIDLIAAHQDNVLGLFAIPLPTFLAAYKAANNLLGGIPSPTVNHNLDKEISHVNGTPRLKSAASEAVENAIVVGNAKGNDNDEEDNTDDDDAMIDAANAVKAAAEALPKFHMQTQLITSLVPI